MKNDRLSVLPDAFLNRMQEMLGTDYEEFLKAMNSPEALGLE